MKTKDLNLKFFLIIIDALKRIKYWRKKRWNVISKKTRVIALVLMNLVVEKVNAVNVLLIIGTWANCPGVYSHPK